MEGVSRAWCIGLGLVVVASVGAWGCGDDLPDEASGASVGTRGSGGSSSGGTSGAPPEVVDIGQDVLLLREDESVVLTVVVVDPDEDVISGELFGPGEPSKYGDLSPHPNGRWQGSVRWSDVAERWPLQFERALELPFSVRLVDAEGHVGEAETTVRAVCGGLTDFACGGTCVDSQIDPAHCGGCDRPCMAGEPLASGDPNGGCMGGDCKPRWGECFVAEPGLTCASQCAAEGTRCAAQGCLGHTLMRHEIVGNCERATAGSTEALDCDGDLAPWSTFVGLRCCCG